MKAVRSIIATLVIVCVLVLSGCVLPTSPPAADFNSYLALPYEGSVFQLGTPIDLYANAISLAEGRGITNLIYYANGSPVGSEAPEYDAAANEWWAELLWTPPSVGEYSVQVQAVRRGGTYISAPVRVCVIDFPIDSGTYGPAFGYGGPCPIPDRDSSARPGALTFAAEATPDSVSYSPDVSATPSCPYPTISFQATVVDPPEDVALVTVVYSFPYGPGTGPSVPPGTPEVLTIVLTQTASFAGSARIYTGTAGFVPRESALYFGGVGGDISWTAQAIGRDATLLATDGPHTIPASPCTPAPLSAPFPALTATPASARDCPAGTFFAETTHKCLPVQIQPTKKGGGSPNCSQYTTDTACNAAPGCSYDYVAKKCK
jgi:hypothetical protein